MLPMAQQTVEINENDAVLSPSVTLFSVSLITFVHLSSSLQKYNYRRKQRKNKLFYVLHYLDFFPEVRCRLNTEEADMKALTL
jgi:hypothetical protein